MTRSEMIEAVACLMRSDGTEAELDALLSDLADQQPASDISELIFWSRNYTTAEQIVDEALRRGRENVIRL